MHSKVVEACFDTLTNLNCINHAAVIYNDKIIETNMDDIESDIVMDYYIHNKHFMEE